MAKIGCVLVVTSMVSTLLSELPLSFVFCKVIHFRKTHLHVVFKSSDSTPTLSASMHWPSGLCSTSKSSEKCSSSCRWASTDRVYWQLAFSAYEAGQEGLDMSPWFSPDRSSEQLTVLKMRVHCHHLHHFNQHNHMCYTISSDSSPSFFPSPPPVCLLLLPLFSHFHFMFQFCAFFLDFSQSSLCTVYW